MNELYAAKGNRLADMKLLLISDNKETGSRIHADLKPEGFDVDQVASAEDALFRLKSCDDVNLILIDFHSDAYDPMELCQNIKAIPVYSVVPVVAILNVDPMHAQVLAFEIGVDDFLMVPYNQVELQLKIRSVRRLMDLRNELQNKEVQLERLKSAQQIMVTLNHHINNALTPLYFAVQIMDMEQPEEARRLKELATSTVEFITKVLQSLNRVVQSGKVKIYQEGVYKNMLIDLQKELDQLLEKSQ